MPWYTVTKRINGREYLYLQMTYREGKKVRTKNKYLGPARGSGFAQGAPSNLPTASEYPKVERPSGGVKVDAIRRLKPRTRARINRAAAKARLADEATANWLDSNDGHANELRRHYHSIFKSRLRFPRRKK